MTEIQKRIQIRIKEKGISARSLAMKAGIPVSSLKNILQGKVENPRYDTINAIAEALGETAASLMPNVNPSSDGFIGSISQSSTAGHYQTVKNYYDVIDVKRFKEAFLLIAPIYAQYDLNLSKAKFINLVNELYEYIKMAEEKGNASDINTTIVEWIVKQEINK